MSIGRTYRSESRTQHDARIGAVVRQVTDAVAIHHQPFFYIPAYDDSGHSLFLISYRSGTPQVFLEDGRGGSLIQLTHRPDLDEWSVHPAHNGRYVYYTAGGIAWRTNIITLVEESICRLGDAPVRRPGMVGAAMGTTSVSHDDCWWCVPVRVDDGFQMHIIDTSTGLTEVVLEQRVIGHPQFHPQDANLLRYCGSHDERIWVVRRDGTLNHLAYQRDASRKEWIVHETWLPGGREIIASNWPNGVIGIDIDTGHVRWLSRTNAWHPVANRDGTQMVADTVHPDIGIVLFEVPQVGEKLHAARTLCYPEASSLGEHWKTDHCPYDDGPVEAYAPQYTHPHPSFSPDGTRVVFTSDRTGMAQVYEVEVPDAPLPQ